MAMTTPNDHCDLKSNINKNPQNDLQFHNEVLLLAVEFKVDPMNCCRDM